tara:strand:+ start:67 stop:573 length:507 start_codon:yes stop_codon:yes gene_type:complete
LRNIVNPTDIELQDETVVCINRVSTATTGGRTMGFNSIVTIGDGNGHVGLGFGKANDVASAVNKAKENAKKQIFKVPLINGTIPHTLNIKFGSVKLMLKPASPGTGVIASGPVRAILEQVGVSDILAKSTGSNNQINVSKAVIEGLKTLRDPITVARQRGITVKELFS